ncbi:PulJ/GspJ family protein [Acidisoma sp. 7E03]
MTPHRERGFTLVEMLVALVVLGFVIAGLAQGLRFGMSAWALQSKTIAADAALDTTDRVLRSLLARMEPGYDPHQPAIRGLAYAIAFTADLPRNAPIGPSHLADIAIGVQPGMGLVLRWVPEFHAQWITPPRPQVTSLLPGVTAIRFAYYGGQGTDPPAWHDAWTGNVPPLLIRMHLSLTQGAPWPDIIVAPMRLPDSG